ncbi:MAG TPA: hypothetical protein VNT75_21965, partial [Symbiobacteriaceae bacterium]|nr:hypothetical protein [Symbiobacteriaceae bacterium]
PQERVMLPTRIVETFALSFQGRPVELPSGALLGDLLSRIEVLDRGPVDAKTIAAEVRALAAGSSSGLQNRVFGVSRENLDAVLNAALRTWVTDVLPALRTEPAEDAGVLLAQLDVKISEQGELQHVTVDDSARPYLLPVQLMQELLQRRLPGAGTASGRARPDRRTERALSRLDMVLAPAPAPAPEEAVASAAEAEAEAAVAPLAAAPAPVASSRVLPFVSVFRDWSAVEPTLRLKFHTPSLKGTFTVTVQLMVDTMGFGFIRNRPAPQKSLTMLADNLYELVLEERAGQGDHFQLTFDLRTMETQSGEKLDQLARSGSTAWMGFDGEYTVTAFCDSLRPVTSVVAAGIFRTDGRTQGRNLTVEAERDGICRLSFTGYRKDGIYIVKATPLAGQSERTPTLEVLGGRDEHGILARVVYPENRPVPAEFMVEISCVHTDE